MAGRRLAPDEQALWARVAATVTPLLGRARTPIRHPDESRDSGLGLAQKPRTASIPQPVPRRDLDKAPGETLDGHWDRRLRQGTIAPERSIDLHGHTLISAHAALDHALERAIADDVRLLLVVTGRPPRPGETRRGLIRAQIGDWLAASRHRGRIAAIRNAHPRHGGAGALYLILRRRRP
jgi:DNA-nicking Smr family endonuclease